MARPKKYQHRREFQADDETDKLVNDWRQGTRLSYAEAVRDMIGAAVTGYRQKRPSGAVRGLQDD